VWCHRAPGPNTDGRTSAGSGSDPPALPFRGSTPLIEVLEDEHAQEHLDRRRVSPMHQGQAISFPEIGLDLLVEFIILKPPIQLLEHWVDPLCHLRHPRKHIFVFVAIHQHRLFLLCCMRTALLPFSFTRRLPPNGFTGSVHRGSCELVTLRQAGSGAPSGWTSVTRTQRRWSGKRQEALGQLLYRGIGFWRRLKASILHHKLVLVCGAKWKRPVKRVYGIGRKGNGAICAPNRQNESSPIGSISLWSGLHFAPQTSTIFLFLLISISP